MCQRVFPSFPNNMYAPWSPLNPEQVWLSARFVVAGIGSVPNSELFKDSLVLTADGGIVTDSSLRASHPSGDVFAAGDVACAPVPRGGYDEGNCTAAGMRFEHVQTARDMGMHVAGAMLERAGSDRSYDSVPHMYSRSVPVPSQSLCRCVASYFPAFGRSQTSNY